jgi:hypothetical protein
MGKFFLSFAAISLPWMPFGNARYLLKDNATPVPVPVVFINCSN